MAACKRQNMRDKFPEKLIRVHKHRKVTAIDRYKLFVRRFDCTEILPCERGRSRKVLGSLEEKHGDCKLKPEILRRRGPGLWNETVAAQNLPVNRIVQISHGITGSDQSKSKSPWEESICAFETVRPSALYAVALTVRVRWWANAAQFGNSRLISGSLRFLQQRGIRHRVVLFFIGDLACAHVSVEKVWSGLRHS